MYFVYIFIGNVVAWPVTIFFNNFMVVHRFLLMVFGGAVSVLVGSLLGLSGAAIIALWPWYIVCGVIFAVLAHMDLSVRDFSFGDVGQAIYALLSGLLFGLLILFLI